MAGPELELHTFRHAWGAVGRGTRFASFVDFVPEVKALGYQGIELAPVVFVVMPGAYGDAGAPELRSLLSEHDLDLVPMVMTYGATAEDHLDAFERQLEQALTWSPPLVVSHTGSDAMDEATGTRLLERCVAASEQAGVRVAHETHRGRVLNTPWRTAAVLDAVPELWLKADFSHFVCSAERLLDDAAEVMARLCARAVHADHRIGYENGPQVPDPSGRRWSPHRAAFEAWWDQVWRAAEARGEGWSGVTPEYGPASYAPSDMDADSLWAVCESAVRTSRERFGSGDWRLA